LDLLLPQLIKGLGQKRGASIFFLLGIVSNPFSPGDPDFVLLIQQQL
jgi:hypothetical protein